MEGELNEVDQVTLRKGDCINIFDECEGEILTESEIAIIEEVDRETCFITLDSGYSLVINNWENVAKRELREWGE